MEKIIDQAGAPPKATGKPGPPTHTRYWVIVFAATLAIITYIDRVCISQAAPLITHDLGLTDVQMGWAFSVFLWAYALFEIPGGWMGDRLGARRVLMRVVVWWSFFTAATGWVWSYSSLLVTRTLFGAGEAGCFPNLTKAFTTWLPQRERVRAQGFMWLAARWGGAFTPLLVAFMIKSLSSWRRAFEIFGAVGIVWAVIFYLWYRDNPRDHKSVNEAERAIMPPAELVTAGHSRVPWGQFVRSRTVWLLWLQYFLLTWGWTFYITWLPTYLKEGRHVELQKGALLAGLPLFFGGLGCVFCGYISGYFVRRITSIAASRRWLAGIGFSGAGLCLLLSVNINDPVWAMVAMGFASFSNDLVMPPAWGACMDVGGKFTGTLSGSMNMMGNLGGALSAVVNGYILDYTHNWTITIYLSAALYFGGTFCWMFLDPVTPIRDSESTSPPGEGV